MKYGLFLIFKPDMAQASREVQDVLSRVHASVEKVEDSPPAHLAYAIKKIQTGVYQWITFSADSKVIPEIQKSLLFVSGLLRSMITHDVGAGIAPPPRASRETAAPSVSAAAPRPRTTVAAPKMTQEEIDKQIEEMLKDEVVK